MLPRGYAANTGEQINSGWNTSELDQLFRFQKNHEKMKEKRMTVRMVAYNLFGCFKDEGILSGMCV